MQQLLEWVKEYPYAVMIVGICVILTLLMFFLSTKKETDQVVESRSQTTMYSNLQVKYTVCNYESGEIAVSIKSIKVVLYADGEELVSDDLAFYLSAMQVVELENRIADSILTSASTKVLPLN